MALLLVREKRAPLFIMPRESRLHIYWERDCQATQNHGDRFSAATQRLVNTMCPQARSPKTEEMA